LTELLLGVDVGTASSKAVLATPDGTVVASARREHRLSLPRPGWAEHDPERVWWDDVRALCAELLGGDGAGRAARIRAVGVSGIGPCLAPCDRDDRPLRPAILYGIDTRATAEIAELEQRFGADEILGRCGSALSSQAVGPKLLWLARHEPAVSDAMRRWHMASSFVVARLTGRWVLDHHSASQCDPLYDLDASTWATDWAAAVAPGVPLPELAWPGEVVGAVHTAGAEATGIPVGTPVVAGTIDAWAEAVSAGVRAPGELMVMYGSTMFLVAVVGERQDARAIWTTRGVDAGSLTRAAGMATAGSLTNWLRELAGGVPFAQLTAEAGAVAPGADGLLVLPYFAGERTPILDPRARGVIAGLTLRHTRGHLYRAALEGIALGVRHNLEAMGTRPSRAVAVGGGTAGRLWTQIVSDACDLRQEIPAETIGAGYGDARLAAEGVGLTAPGGSWATIAERVEPQPAQRAEQDARYRLYRTLYPATREVVHALVDGGGDDG
jgi:xylulokinase